MSQRFNVFGISEWAESPGERFAIFSNREFDSVQAAIEAAQTAYSEDLELVIEVAQG